MEPPITPPPTGPPNTQNSPTIAMLRRRGTHAIPRHITTNAPVTPYIRRLQDNQAAFHLTPGYTPTSAPRTAPRDVFSGVVAGRSTLPYTYNAGTSGALGRAEQNTLIAAATQAQAPPPYAAQGSAFHRRTNDDWLPHRVKLYYFRNMHVEATDLMHLYDEPNIEDTRAWSDICKVVEKWRVDLQGRVWGLPWFHEYVREQVRAYNKSQAPNASGFGEDTPYDALPTAERIAFWTSPDRFNKNMLAEVLSPLKKAVDINKVWNDDRWKKYMRAMFMAACHSTWKFRGRWEDGKNPDKINQLQIYQNIRDAPELLAANRPLVSEVPAVPGAINSSRRGIRQTDGLDEFAGFEI